MPARTELGRPTKVPRICRAIRDAREVAEVSTHTLAGWLGVSQSQIQRWETIGEPSLSVIAAIEKVFGRPPGDLLRAAGYVGDEVSVQTAVETDPELDERARRALLALYRSLSNGRR